MERMIEYYKSSSAYGEFLRKTDSSEYLIYVGMLARFVSPADGQVLDIDCGPGAGTSMLRQRGSDAGGTDINYSCRPPKTLLNASW